MSEVPLTPEQIQKTDEQVRHEGYFARLPRAFDIFCGELFGMPMDRTISSEMQDWCDNQPAGSVKNDIGRFISHGLDMIQRQHGQFAEEADAERAREELAREQRASSH